MADLYVCSHGQTKPCDQCATQLENKLEPCPLCRKPLTILPNGFAYCRNVARESGSIDDWKAKSCLMSQHATQLPIATWRALNSRAPVVAPVPFALPVRIEGWHKSLTAGGWYIKDASNRIILEVAFDEQEETVGRPIDGGNPTAQAVVKLINAAPSPSSPVPAEQGDSHQSEQWKRDLIAAGWVAVSAIKWRAPDGSLWRGPYGAWKELQRQREDCSGCAVSRAGVGRCRIHEPVNPAATPTPVEQEHGYWPTIIDRGNGVKGYYCIGRLIQLGEPYWEFWNKGEWVSAGEVFIGREAAEAQLFAIRRGTNWQGIASAPKDLPALRLFAPDLIHEDFNPFGSVEGYWQDDDGWVGAVWNSCQDCWDRKQINPTHWQLLPAPPR